MTSTELGEALVEVTVEEFRIHDFRIERDARLGRRLLFLLANEEWLRRTSENVEIRRVRVVDTEVVVDVDLSYITHSALAEPGPLWLPILALPAAAPAPGRRPDPITSVEVTDAQGARVHKATQSQVHRHLAAAVAELFLGHLPRVPAGDDPPVPRDELVLLTAAVRRLLAAGLDASGQLDADIEDVVDTPPAWRIDTGRARTEERLTQARSALLSAFDLDRDRPRPALRSRLAEVLAALVGTAFVVVPLDRAAPPTSFSVRLPGRRLQRDRRRRGRLEPRARLHVDLVGASPHADRQVRLTLPEGVGTVAPAPAGRRTGRDRHTDTGRDPVRPDSAARITVDEPRPFAELRALTRLVVDPDTPAGSWTQRRLASMAVDKVSAAVDVLNHYRPVREQGVLDTRAVTERLRHLREALLDVVDVEQADASARTAVLHRLWDDGRWLPARLDRRLAVNRATPGVVLLRATTVEGMAQRGRTVGAGLDLWVEVTDSSVLDTARDTNLINTALLGLVTVILAFGGDGYDRQVLATVLTLFPAIQASRVDRPDRSTLRGLLALPTYWLSLATAFPPLLLATLLALDSLPRDGLLSLGPVPPIATIALLAAALQFSLYLVLRRRERPPGDQPTLLLTTDHPPDLARLDVLRGIWCRTLVTDALLIGRQASAWVTAGVDRPGALGAALDGGLPGGRSTDADPAHDVQGVLHATHGGHALTFAVVGGPGAEYAGSGPARPRPLVLDHDRVAPTEPPTWIVEVLVGIPRSAAAALTAGRHPLGVLAGAAAAAGFNVVHAQHPTAPPWHGPADREWMRARIGVPFVPGEDLSGLRSLLLAVDHLRGVDPGWGSPRVHVHVVPELATYEAVQTAPDDPARRGPANGERSRAATEVDISGSVPPDGLDVDPRVQPLALFATARPGLLAGVLASLVEVAPQARVAGVTVGALHGLTGVFLFLRDAGPRPGEAVRARIAPAHEVQVAVDGHQPPPADTAIGTAPAVRGNELLRLQIRTPDRPAALRSTLASFEALIRRRAEDAGRTSDPLDVWFAMFRVAEGRTVQGRLVARLPAGVDWTTTGWDGLAQAATDHSDADRVEDDAFVTADLLRTVDDPAPTVVDARPAVGE